MKILGGLAQGGPSVKISNERVAYKKYRFSVVEFSVSIWNTPKFICSSDDGVPRLLITEYHASYKSYIYKSRMIWVSYKFKIEFIIYIL